MQETPAIVWPRRGRHAVRGLLGRQCGSRNVLDIFPDGQRTNPHHLVAGDRGVTQWTFVATMPDGSKAEVDGCDPFPFRNGKIAVKNSFRKNRTK